MHKQSGSSIYRDLGLIGLARGGWWLSGLAFRVCFVASVWESCGQKVRPLILKGDAGVARTLWAGAVGGQVRCACRGSFWRAGVPAASWAKLLLQGALGSQKAATSVRDAMAKS